LGRMQTWTAFRKSTLWISNTYLHRRTAGGILCIAQKTKKSQRCFCQTLSYVFPKKMVGPSSCGSLSLSPSSQLKLSPSSAASVKGKEPPNVLRAQTFLSPEPSEGDYTSWVAVAAPLSQLLLSQLRPNQHKRNQPPLHQSRRRFQ